MKRLNPIENMLAGAGDMGMLLVNTIKGTFRKDFPVSLLMEQIIRIGIDSVFVVLVTTFFTGMVMSLQISLILEKLLTGISQFTGGAVGVAMVKELSPMLVGLVIAGRIGSAITAEIGTMEISEQISALKTLNTSPVVYLVVPRFWAGVITLPILTFFGDIVGVIGGGLVSAFVFGLNLRVYFQRAIEFISISSVNGGLIKAAFFGAIITLVASYVGLNTEGGAEGVGKSTTKSVVLAFMLLLVFDYILTLILSNFGM